MKIVLDHCLPHDLQHTYRSHEVVTASYMGWDPLRNGLLLAAVAAAGFDLLLTVDKNIRHQQNLTTLPVAVVVMMSPSSLLPDLVPFAPAVEAALLTLVPRTLVDVELP